MNVLLLSMVPLFAVLFFIVGLRQPAHVSAALGLALAILIVGFAPSFSMPGSELTIASASALLLLINAVWVMLPGVYLNEILTRRGMQTTLAEWVSALPMTRSDKIALVVAGIAPGVESMTGFGISLFITIPVLLALAERRVALRQAMLSVNIMPWGTLALATIVGAGLAGVSVIDLGLASAIASLLIFPLMTGMAVALSERSFSAIGRGVLLGTLFSAWLLLFNFLQLVEIAGVLAGAATTLIGLLLYRKKAAGGFPPVPWRCLYPYGIALGLILLLRLGIASGALQLDWFTLRSGATSFNVITSPGSALLVTALLLERGHITVTTLKGSIAKLRRPVLALACFIAMAQLMSASGMIAAIGASVASMGAFGVQLMSPVLGMLSGFITGSNMGANALMMPLQAGLGEPLGMPVLLFSAIQNSAAGHAVFTSLPNILLILTIAAGLGHREQEASLLRFGFGVALVVWPALFLGLQLLRLAMSAL